MGTRADADYVFRALMMLLYPENTLHASFSNEMPNRFSD
jgi:hypothetical protein